MSIELRVPEVGESITEVEIGDWLKREGDTVQKDENVVTLESEKATVELPAPQAGVLAHILKQKGQTARVGEVIAQFETAGGAASAPKKAGAKPAAAQPEPALASQPRSQAIEARVMPAAQVALEEHNLRPADVQGTGPGGRILKEDVLRQIQSSGAGVPAAAASVPPSPTDAVVPEAVRAGADRQQEVVPMSRLRRTVAERLVAAQHNAALLTTFNEIDMSAVIALRKEHGEAFQNKYQVKLGFMSFFVKAGIDALKQFPAVNAEVREANIIYHNYYDIGVAVGSGRGLVVPVLRNAERMSFAEIEVAIGDFARRAKENKLKLEELQGGTFTISNGGVYGSLLSTPIVNPPQSGVLGLHAIQERPVAREGAVVIRPMMYVALTYDHRLVDGREGVSFLKRIKEVIENPARMLMEV
jgi:2-oxoglutarate dehydrogenase E2 component (dihydrolipoamide succinyltransferase)